jgi:DNA-directed RNA polymerase subunit delta
MTARSDKEKKVPKKSAPSATKETPKPSPKPKNPDEDEDEEVEEVDETKAPVKKNAKAASKSKKKEDVDDDDFEEEVEEVDEWEKVEEEDNWDPDFDEFDVPKSKSKKSTGGAKKTAKGDEDELGLDEDFKDLDLFGEGNFEEEDDDF